ncbi:hypothetical protein PG985_003034 [Apiospora marii]|uniref:uncharacterized protein n=1 Tax=Apiospora marii TaxID=335849 RepID=UPI00313199CB
MCEAVQFGLPHSLYDISISPFKAPQALAAELLKTAKTRNIEAALPITTRWIPRAALAAGEALARANGGGPNLIEKRMLRPAEMILVGAPPPTSSGPDETASTAPLVARHAVPEWVDGLNSGTREICGLCGTRKGRSDRGLYEVGLGNFRVDPVERLLGLGGCGPGRPRWQGLSV